MKKALISIISVLLLAVVGLSIVASEEENNVPPWCDRFAECVEAYGHSYYSNSGGGISKYSMINYLFDEYLDYLNITFATEVQLEDSHKRMDSLQAQINLGDEYSSLGLALEEHKVRANRLEETQYHNEYICVPGNVCVMLVQVE